MLKSIAIGSIAALSVCVGSAAYAEVEEGTYVGGSFGQSSIVVDEINFDGSATGYKAFIGYTFNSYAAIELDYVNSGTATLKGPGGTLDVSGKAVVASAIVSWPFLKSFAAFGKLGFAFVDTDATAKAGAASASATDSNVNVAYGIGASYSFLERYEVRIEYDKIAIDDGDFSMMSLGGVFRF